MILSFIYFNFEKVGSKYFSIFSWDSLACTRITGRAYDIEFGDGLVQSSSSISFLNKIAHKIFLYLILEEIK